MAEFSTIEYDKQESGVARIVLNRPDTRNAQNKAMIYELNAAFDEAGRDDPVGGVKSTSQLIRRYS